MVEVVFFGKNAGLCPNVLLGFAEIGQSKKGESKIVGNGCADRANDVLVLIGAGGECCCKVGRSLGESERAGLGNAHAEAERAALAAFRLSLVSGDRFVPFLYRVIALDELGTVNGGKFLDGRLALLILFFGMNVWVVIVVDDLKPVFEKLGKICAADRAANMEHEFWLLRYGRHV